MRDGTLHAGYAIEDGVALHFVDDRRSAVVSSRPKAIAYQVRLENGEVIEEPLETRFLGGHNDA